jgi:HK97 family phage major capsid protein
MADLKAIVTTSDETSFTLGGYGVVFDGEDLEGETFTKETDFWASHMPERPPVLYQHGQDKALKRAVLGHATVTVQDVGLWVETQISLAHQYAAAIRELAEKGVLGWSSGAVGHLVEREGKTIKSWPIAEFSLTPIPAEPRTLGVHELRSLAEFEPVVEGLLPEAGAQPAAGETKARTEPAIVATIEEIPMEEETKTVNPTVDPNAIADQVMAALKARLDAEPAYQKAFIQAPEGTDHAEEKSFADWLVAVQRKDVKRLERVYGSAKALAENEGTTGGYLVPPAYSQEILRVSTDAAVVRPRARIVPMGGREVNFPVLDYTGSTAGKPPTLGGVVVNWTEEAGSKTATEPSFKTIKLVYHELSGYTQASNMLRQDAGPTLESLLITLFGEAIRVYEDWAFLRGTGAGQPLGIFNSPCLLAEVAASSTFVLSDAAAMLRMFKSSSPNAGVWVMHPVLIEKLIAMADGSGATNNVIWIPNARESLPATLFGKPIIFSDLMPVLPPGTSAATKGGVLLADFSYYLIGQRSGIQIDYSDAPGFLTNQGTWRFMTYVDGQPWLQQPIYLTDGTNQVSPFVTLKGA